MANAGVLLKKPNSTEITGRVWTEMSDPAGKPMDPASFLIQVQFRQNATWQGSIQWLDKKKTQRFRSTLELIQLMDSALDSRGPDEKAFAAWDDSDAGTVPAQKQEEKENA